MWDSSVVAGTPAGLMQWVLITVVPALLYAILARGFYMFHYRYVDDSIESYYQAATNTTPVLCSPTRELRLSGPNPPP